MDEPIKQPSTCKRRVWIGGSRHEVTADEIEQEFAQHGPIEKVDCGFHGIAFVLFEDEESAARACSATAYGVDLYLRGTVVDVKLATERGYLQALRKRDGSPEHQAGKGPWRDSGPERPELKRRLQPPAVLRPRLDSPPRHPSAPSDRGLSDVERPALVRRPVLSALPRRGHSGPGESRSPDRAGSPSDNGRPALVRHPQPPAATRNGSGATLRSRSPWRNGGTTDIERQPLQRRLQPSGLFRDCGHRDGSDVPVPRQRSRHSPPRTPKAEPEVSSAGDHAPSPEPISRKPIAKRPGGPKVAQHFADPRDADDIGRVVLLLTAHGPLARGTQGTVVSINRRGILSLDNRVFCDPERRGRSWEFADVCTRRGREDSSPSSPWVKVSGDHGVFLYNSESGEVADPDVADPEDLWSR